ncbi:MAG: hypothetical protein KBD01_18250 [Acidobacteria bacterium]|nr:hypothetical protein [Acidobacteriota bacterium]
MDWLRIDADMPEHTKVFRLARALRADVHVAFSVAARLLCRAARYCEDGDVTGEEPEDIARFCRYDGDPARLFEALVAAGWLDQDGDRVVIHGWQERQAYALRERERKRAARADGARTVRAASADGPRTVRAQRALRDVRDVRDEQDGRDVRTKDTRPAAPDGACAENAPAVPVEWGAEVWARHCASLPQPRTPISDKRRKSWATRCREPGFLDAFEDVCRKVGASEFCQGKSRTGWAATFDWLLERADAWQKVLEGKYDNRAPALPAHRTAGANRYHNEQLAELFGEDEEQR